jgi:hypothetical protein
MSTRPVCPCHDHPMYWDADRRKRTGGYWRCLVQKREWQRAWARARYRNDFTFWVKRQIRNRQDRARRAAA